jgi:hypothetical protein
MGIIGRGLDYISEVIERAGRGREDLYSSLEHATRRANELAAENAELQDRIDVLESARQELEDRNSRLRSNGPALSADEISTIEGLLTNLVLRVSTGVTSRLDEDRKKLRIMYDLLERCDPQPFPMAPPEHHNPPPGYAPCTRGWPHSGSCAHPGCDDCVTLAFDMAAAGTRPFGPVLCSRCESRKKGWVSP